MEKLDMIIRTFIIYNQLKSRTECGFSYARSGLFIYAYPLSHGYP